MIKNKLNCKCNKIERKLCKSCGNYELTKLACDNVVKNEGRKMKSENIVKTIKTSTGTEIKIDLFGDSGNEFATIFIGKVNDIGVYENMVCVLEPGERKQLIKNLKGIK